LGEITIEKMYPGSWDDVARIYLSGILTGNATFEDRVPDRETWERAHRKDCRLVARMGDKIVGWAALAKVSARTVYSGVAEVSIYVDPDHQGRGIGDRLMESLVTESENRGIWTLQASIFPENTASIKLHQKHGFRAIGTRENIGKMGGRWRDVVLLERRSRLTGTDTE